MVGRDGCGRGTVSARGVLLHGSGMMACANGDGLDGVRPFSIVEEEITRINVVVEGRRESAEVAADEDARDAAARRNRRRRHRAAGYDLAAEFECGPNVILDRLERMCRVPKRPSPGQISASAMPGEDRPERALQTACRDVTIGTRYGINLALLQGMPASEPTPLQSLPRSFGTGLQRWQYRDDAADRIRSLILSGRLSPGSYVRLEPLAQEFGISVTPVREAMMMLREQGFVDLHPNRGFIVLGFSLRDLEDLFSRSRSSGVNLPAEPRRK